MTNKRMSPSFWLFAKLCWYFAKKLDFTICRNCLVFIFKSQETWFNESKRIWCFIWTEHSFSPLLGNISNFTFSLSYSKFIILNVKEKKKLLKLKSIFWITFFRRNYFCSEYFLICREFFILKNKHYYR